MTAESEYTRQATAAELELQFASGRFQQTWVWFSSMAAVGIALLYLAFANHSISAWCVLPAAIAIIGVMKERGRIALRIQRAHRRLRFYREGLARLVCQQAGAGELYLDPEHIYTRDLSVFGASSLFSLLCTARTGVGQNTLARWLSEPAALPEIRARQQAVEELRTRLDLRESIALVDPGCTSRLNPDSLLTWLDHPAVVFPKWARVATFLAAMIAAVSGILALTWSLSHQAFLVSLAPEMIFAGVFYQRVRTVVESLAVPALDLGLLVQLLLILEREVFRSPLLQGIQLRLQTAGTPASSRIRQLRRLAELLHFNRNDWFGYISYLLLWCTQFSLAIESWRASFGQDLRGWLASVGEFEALNSIAGYAYEHPDDPFPELTDTPSAIFEAEALGHPLIRENTCVRNDIHLNCNLQALVVSGSNMSGKSTFLRAVGLNAVLALAGAPVRARRLRLSRLAIATAIQMEDSLEAGRSRFAAEVLRLRRTMDVAAGSVPVIFLLDEVLSGTNSRDRRIGAGIIVRHLLDQGAIGMVATHDLSLTEIAGELHPRAANIYFEDSFDDGKMVFDYKAHPGVLIRSNALALMRTLGIPV